MLSVNNITIIRGKEKVLDNVSCSLSPGKITCFVGKSGAGKTTLLKAMAGLIKPAQGTVVVDGEDVLSLSAKKRAQTVGYVFQEHNLFPHMTAFENCLDPLLVHGIDKDSAKERVEQVLRKFEMQAYSGKYPNQLSGGQQQRIALARTLALQPKVLLLDEPTAALDGINSDILVKVLIQLKADTITIAITSHDREFVNKCADVLCEIENGRAYSPMMTVNVD